MRFFLRSKQFKKTVLIVVTIILLTVTAGIIGGFMAPQAGIMGAVAAPFQKLATLARDSWNDFSENFKSAAKLSAENEKLQIEINDLRQQLADYHEAVNENAFYEEYLEIKDENPDFKFHPALVISSDPDDIFGGFTVDAGSVNGISLYDPVITDAGLVGYISQVGATVSKVTTILDAELTCGAFDSRTLDAGAVSGDTELAAKGYTRFFNLQRTCSVAVGDLVVTSGSGIFPDKLIVGTVNNIENDPLSSSLFAVITPAVNFGELRNVMIITDFEGQGNELIDGE